jgi:hypothetical protein
MFDGQTKSYRGSVILDIDTEALDIERVEDAFHDLFQVIEGIGEMLDTRTITIAIPRIIGRDHMKVLGENWKKVPKHMGRRRKPVQQYERLRMLFSCLTIKHLNVIDHHGSVRDGCHGSTPFEETRCLPG